jgi:lipopolysaccharide biosynthesis regulator YciM
LKTKLLLIIVVLFVLFYLYLAHLNPETVRLFIGSGRFYETSLANFIMFAFLLGVLLATVVGLFSDLGRRIKGFQERRRQRKEDEIRSLLEKAKALFSSGEQEKARELLERIIRERPEKKEAYLELSNLYLARGDKKRALEIVNLAKTNVGKQEEILLRGAQLYLMMKDYPMLEGELKEILRINPSNVRALSALRNLHVMKKDWEGALDVARRLRRVSKTVENERALLGIRYERAREIIDRNGNKLDDAIKELKELLDEDKRFAPAYIALAEAYRRKGRHNDAARVYGRGYTKTGHVIFLFKMEDFYIERGDPAVILKIYRRLLDVSPKNEMISLLYARLLLRLEMIDEALEVLNTVSARGATFPALHRALAEAYLHRGDVETAIKEMRKALPKRDLYISFFCTNCSDEKEEWTAFCERCGRWNTINLKGPLEPPETFLEGLLKEEEIDRWPSLEE